VENAAREEKGQKAEDEKGKGKEGKELYASKIHGFLQRGS